MIAEFAVGPKSNWPLLNAALTCEPVSLKPLHPLAVASRLHLECASCAWLPPHHRNNILVGEPISWWVCARFPTKYLQTTGCRCRHCFGTSSKPQAEFGLALQTEGGIRFGRSTKEVPQFVGTVWTKYLCLVDTPVDVFAPVFLRW